MEKDNSKLDFEQELHEHFAFDINSGQEPLRIDKFLMSRIENATRNKIQKAAKEGSIRVNDKIVKSSYKVKKDDKVRILFSHPPYENLLTPEKLDLDIEYEDDSIIIVNKKSGMVVHPGHGNYSGTLINALLYHFDNLPNNSSNRPGLVHRIDKDTSGLLVIAKTEKSMTLMAKQFFNKSVEREYYALVWGDVKDDEGEINAPIGRNPKNRLQMIVYEDMEGGKEAITNYKVIERFGYVTLISCRLQTGRTHQIRVHMKYLGHTLFNDERYGGNKILKGTVYSKYKQFVDNCFRLLPRQALHAKTLGFIHPKSKEKISFNSDIPEDIASVIDKWRLYSKHKNL
ncbi:MAG: RluA family pseudouridine synthase [Cryomorphaceae bacterium]|jgi:23S rRNA pseudouridine1911/1915/1917 synthase|nr:RluA family pseudouridine synthase [Cryomorphaceae bacterium]MDG1889594.1 RluA family pseudouridine synthase [Flavobacteriaceae bacterium]MBT3503881.1 RluA family pseudouridine synthase [Cryomorphaceae bacterium]MBT3689081.1 RluA family pseudouridine synthase [Cryomorphaceae bacterium]MBT4222308.1 RluA family pseudouridine synthase [Cryomorphaceae bacterium]|tara:strand:+ start:251 stop:1279 length:1029 start_codon:yes stop_codon:yes gene_type:complete